MQDVQSQSEPGHKCCSKGGKSGGQRARHRGRCGSSHGHEATTAAAASPLEILQQRFARGEIDTAEFEEKRRLIANG